MRGFDILLDPAGFDWREAPLSQWYWPAGTAIVYLLVVVAMLPGAVRAGDANTAAASEYRAWVKSMSPEALAALPEGKRKQDPRQLPAAKSWGGIMCWHNLVLFAWSAAMFAGCAYEILVRFGTEGGSAGFLFCEAPLAASDEASSAGTFDASERFAAAGGGAATGALYFWSYIYYLSKFYELFDTVLALAKGSPPRHLFLHVFHHTLVMGMAWLWLEQRQSLQWIGLLFNTFVHVVMYYYFSRTAIGVSVWWKNYITALQIVQFVSSLVAFAVFARAAAGADIAPLLPAPVAAFWAQAAAAVGLPAAGSGWSTACSGWDAVRFNLFFNVTLLLGFVDVLGKNSSAARKPKPKQE